ncbi:ECF subfamily RNA polymerase sigma factor (plasmid) [Streptantibioticus cattleyicolor NRRL 8057 = DSM 46488]|uniref:ECF subfamily RNA polymerase sigma factor n=1 Tax=Streptantibioticus cattleyicolor (strain ATCC 35852 / DSM 46488 / JCM 4925 / NBRC 14057 / NRRL 8057) TaxID=1003195 RepID=G8XGZ2_STREN|nr:ECF subfamily RNA polymerase sigma factor [Streptantibioticus cattleyicolor NRRL 8057 = DSM 46488]
MHPNDGVRVSAEHPGRDGFDEVFCELLPRLYRRAAMLAGESAQDVVHETYLRLAARPERLTAHPVPYAYAFRALVSTIRDDARRRRRQVLTGQPPEVPSGGGVLELREAEWQVRWLLRQLTLKQAAAVVLVDLDAHTIDEAAEILGVHRGTISRARARALDALRTLTKDPTA